MCIPVEIRYYLGMCGIVFVEEVSIFQKTTVVTSCRAQETPRLFHISSQQHKNTHIRKLFQLLSTPFYWRQYGVAAGYCLLPKMPK